MKYCPKCGHQIPDYGSFCGKCGTALKAPAAVRVSGAAAAQPTPVKKQEKKLTMAARATWNKKPTIASQAVLEARKREEFHAASLKEKRVMMETALNELLDGRIPRMTAFVNKHTRVSSRAAAV